MAFNPSSLGGRERLYALLQRQHYRLTWWRTAGEEINWRRFFDINDLAAIRVEDDEVFETVHAAVFRLYASGWIDGIRVDHIDGLAQPDAYCRRMRGRLGELERVRPAGAPRGRAYFIVEKILARNESIPIGWDVDGTTGYDFMDEASALLHENAASSRLGICGDALVAGPTVLTVRRNSPAGRSCNAALVLNSTQPSRLSMRSRKQRQLLEIIHDLRFVAP